MTIEELSKIKEGQRVSMWQILSYSKQNKLVGSVTKIYNGNYQLQVLFDDYKKPVVVGYSRLSLI